MRAVSRPVAKIMLTLLSGVAVVGVMTGCQSGTPTRARSEVVVDELIDAPPLQFEEVTVAPSSEHVWVPGSWERDPDEWTWVKGHWETPPNRAAHWQPGHWKWEQGRWHWSRGHWAAGWAERVIADEALPLPAPKAEVITKEPSSEHVWVPGYWERDPGQWTWNKGHWEKPPHKAAHWANGHWQWHEGRWQWNRGHWATADPGWIVDEIIDVPPLLTEQKPPRPSDKNHWVAGYWEWDGKWIWMPGHWTSLPDPKASWVAGHWDEYGTGGGWRWIAGHWRVS